MGYINPDATTYAYIEGKEYAPKGERFQVALAYWNSIRSDADAVYDDIVSLDASTIEPVVTWGITPGQSIGISQRLPIVSELPEGERLIAEDAFKHMKLIPGAKLAGLKIDIAFIGSCTNSRISDLREAAAVFQGRRVNAGVKTIVVPGSQRVKAQAEAEGLDKIFIEAGAEWRDAGCSMCLAMNPDKLIGDQLCASSSNRNFIGRQGSATGRTLLMSPAMVAAAAIEGCVTDIREMAR